MAKKVQRNVFMKAATVAGITVKGNSDSEVLKRFQDKYKLDPTGKLDDATLYKMESVAASKGLKKSLLKKAAAINLVTLRRNLSLNKISDDVKRLQEALVYLGYQINSDEHDKGVFGKTTLLSVIKFQNDHNLKQSGKLDSETRAELNREIIKIKPQSTSASKSLYTIKGSVHNEMWDPMRVYVRVSYETGEIACEEILTSIKGFYNIQYPVPANAKPFVTRSGYAPFNIKVGIYSQKGSSQSLIFERTVTVNSEVTWSNFTEETTSSGVTYNGKCKGDSEFTILMKKVENDIGPELFRRYTCLHPVKPSRKDNRGLRFSKANKIALTEDKLKMLVVSNIVADHLSGYISKCSVEAVIDQDIIYGLLRAGLYDMKMFDKWFKAGSRILTEGKRENLVNSAAVDVIETMFFEPLAKISTAFNKSKTENWINRWSQLDTDAWRRISVIANAVMAQKNFLEDNTSLLDILTNADICTNIIGIAAILKQYGGINEMFLNKLKVSQLLNGSQFQKFEKYYRIGHIVLNNPKFVRATVAVLGNKPVSTLAKWSAQDWAKVGAKGELKNITSRIKSTYPDEKFISDLHELIPNDKTINLLYKDLMFRDGSDKLFISDFDCINSFHYSNNESENIELKNGVSGLRRIYLLTDNAQAAAILWKNNLRSAITVRHGYSKKDFVAFMSGNGIPSDVSNRIYSNVESQYIRIITYYNDYINSASNNSRESKSANLKTLFGSNDAYDYDKSMSLLGQSAYYVDLLRYLTKMPSDIKNRSAYDILIDRRPDLQYINLESRNSETILPYIDLSCEILEREILLKLGKSSKIDFGKYNTTKTSEELLAYPENTIDVVYETIYESDFPATTSHFSLYQEEVRAYLNALGIPRYKIMEKSGAPELSVAAEYFGFSLLELQEISGRPAFIQSQWNLNITNNSVAVREFMNDTGLSYNQTVLLCCDLFNYPLTGADLTNKGYPDIDNQFISIDSYGLAVLQRFIRIWRHIPWDMERLKAFIDEVAHGEIDESVIVLLYRTICENHPNEDITDSSLDNDLLESLSAPGNNALEMELSQKLFEILKTRLGEKWAEKFKEIYDPIRELKRDALVNYFIWLNANSSVVKDASDIMGSLLVDVMMNSKMTTSRIKQATGSIQLFIQRCMLNLEPEIHINAAKLKDPNSLDSWGQWNWMKNYRVWEANRKIFLFPENWIEPELRDNQTPFFKEFMDTIDQMEPSAENFEDALFEYLNKVDEVAHLEVCSIYREKDNESNIDVAHIIGRTKSTPSVYYYRSCNLKTEIWSPWEKVDVDISSEQITLAKYRGKLHLFWLNFTEKVLKPTVLPVETTNTATSHEPIKYYEIQLAWSVMKNGVWQSKSTSKKKLIHPWSRPQYSYDLKPYLDKQGLLHLDVYLSTSPEFNNQKSFDSATNPEFGCQYSAAHYDETYRPWHSSTFIYEGYVSDVYMKNIGPDECMSVDFINKNFGEEGRMIKKLDKTMQGPSLYLPTGMHLKNNRLTNNNGSKKLYVGEGVGEASHYSRELLAKAGDNFEMVVSQQTVQMDTLKKGAMSFFQDNNRAYSLRTSDYYEYQFKPFYHPFTARYISVFNQHGANGLLARNEQKLSEQNSFASRYKPSSAGVSRNYPIGNVDFSNNGAYGIYNWELFFHIPLSVACRLSESQKYEDAMKWFHFIFNPVEYVAGQAPRCYWVTEPFYENYNKNGEAVSSARIESLLKDISKNADLLAMWRNNPFKPHIIAQFRTVVYQKLVVRKYIENLINWADDLFRQDTWETINEAIMLYIMAGEILGQRPEKVKLENKADADHVNFKQIRNVVDLFGNAADQVKQKVDTMLAMENMADVSGFRTSGKDNSGSSIPMLDMFYFNIPSNDTLVAYWDTVEDRLFKIRNSMNIDGVIRELSLNAPEIDPAVLVRAAAAGISVDQFNFIEETKRPKYRFKYIVQKAIELCNEVKATGDKLLSAIEKEDSAQLTEVRAEIDIKALEATTRNRKQEIESIKESIKNLEITKSRAEIVFDYYANIEHLSQKEAKVLQESMSLAESMKAITILNTTAAAVTMLPSVVAGMQGAFSSPVAHGELFSGQSLAASMNYAAGIISSKNSIAQQKSAILSTKASYERRSNEWLLQAKTAMKDIESINSQLTGMQLRLNMAEQELQNHLGNIENNKAIYELVKNQFSNKALYSWLKKETSKAYKQLYDMAYAYAKKAEYCYKFELGDNQPANIPSINPGNWDAGHGGLFAGDNLLVQLRALEMSYLENDKRCFELTKRISLAELPVADGNESALVKLLRDGECVVDIPEWIYDLDYPTHGNRRIKNVSITIPCIVGPNTNINCCLTLLKEIRRSKTDNGKKLSLSTASDIPSDERPGIATSTANNDSGMFEINFNSEKYLPFEGYGAVSRWKVSLPVETNHFDRTSISDVILNITYYAQEYDQVHPQEKQTFVRIVSVRHEFPSEWHRCNVQKDNLEIVLDESMVQSYMKSKFSSFKLAAALKQSKDSNGNCSYEDIADGYVKNGKTITLTNISELIDNSIEDILLVLVCN